MPVVTVDPGEYERFELKSAPPDGYVLLRPLPYGMKLTRRSKATKMMMRAQPTQNRKQAKEQEQVFELDSQDEWAVAYDFAYCIGEHNLEKADGTPVDFTKPMEIRMINPRVGSEIERLIDELNNDEDDESIEDFLKRRSSLSEDNEILLPLDGKGEQTPTVSGLPNHDG